jgi:hypothetical protein
MPQTTLRSPPALPVLGLSPARVRRRQTSPIVKRSRPIHSNTWRTMRAASGPVSSRACPPPAS